jgi:hypothetical protein
LQAASRPGASSQRIQSAEVRTESRPSQRPSSNAKPRPSYEGVRVASRPSRRSHDSSFSVSTSRPVRHDRRPHHSSRGNSAARTIAAVLFFPFSLAFVHHRHPSIYISRPSYYYPYYDYPYYYYSPLYYRPYWWQDAPEVNYNTYNNYTYVQGEQTSDSQQMADLSPDALENVKIQGARFIDNPKSVALTITNETQYVIAGIVFAFVFRGNDFTENIENVHYYFNVPLSEYEKKFMRIDLSGVEFQTPENFSVAAVVQSITTEDGRVISVNKQAQSYNQEN